MKEIFTFLSLRCTVDEANRNEEALEKTGSFDPSNEKLGKCVGLVFGYLVLEPLCVYLYLYVQKSGS